MAFFQVRIEGVAAIQSVQSDCNATGLKHAISQQLGLECAGFYLTQNGRLVSEDRAVSPMLPIFVVPRLLGGKGGFGSMLRAIGAQIEKTTNRDACRDLSGRRLRDINEEQRLKRWFAKQEEREREREENRQKKLEKLRRIQEGPALPLVEDQEYNKIRADMADAVFEAVDKGFEVAKNKDSAEPGPSTSGSSPSSASSSSSSDEKLAELPPVSASTIVPEKRKNGNGDAVKAVPKKKLKKTMLDEDLGSDLSSSDDSDSETSK